MWSFSLIGDRSGPGREFGILESHWRRVGPRNFFSPMLSQFISSYRKETQINIIRPSMRPAMTHAAYHGLPSTSGRDSPCASAGSPRSVPPPPILPSSSRRDLLLHLPATLAALSAATVSVTSPAIAAAIGSEPSLPPPPPPPSLPSPSIGGVGFSGPGPCTPVRLPRIEHTATSVYPRCVGNACLVKCDIFLPQGAQKQGLRAPYPLAILSPGFLIPAVSYASYAVRLASWGYCAILWDKVETLNATLDDVTSAEMVSELIDFVGTDRLLGHVVDASRVFLVGHSRGGKISTLAAAADPRVQALFLIDPVDNTKYAPLGEGYPSACDALTRATDLRGSVLPVGIIGAGVGGDCAPESSNYAKYYNAAAAAWLVVVRDTGHFDFPDETSSLMSSICTPGQQDPVIVRECAQTAMVTFGHLYCRPLLEDAPAAGARGAEEGAGGPVTMTALAQLVADATPPRPSWPELAAPRPVITLASLSISRQLGLEDSQVQWGSEAARPKPAKKRKDRPALESLFKGLELAIDQAPAPS